MDFERWLNVICAIAAVGVSGPVDDRVDTTAAIDSTGACLAEPAALKAA
ncbi:hypothetical protein AB0873_28915 [Micromonospora sp. NPDC047707]